MWSAVGDHRRRNYSLREKPYLTDSRCLEPRAATTRRSSWRLEELLLYLRLETLWLWAPTENARYAGNVDIARRERRWMTGTWKCVRETQISCRSWTCNRHRILVRVPARLNTPLRSSQVNNRNAFAALLSSLVRDQIWYFVSRVKVECSFCSSPPDSVGECMMFSGCPSAAYVCPSVQTDITICHKRLEQFW